MTGPKHYREAERLLEKAGDYTAEDAIGVALAQRAQVHATLALTAARAPAITTIQQEEILGYAWAEAVSS